MQFYKKVSPMSWAELSIKYKINFILTVKPNFLQPHFLFILGHFSPLQIFAFQIGHSLSRTLLKLFKKSESINMKNNFLSLFQWFLTWKTPPIVIDKYARTGISSLKILNK